MNEINYDLTVIIPSIGDKKIFKLLEHLNKFKNKTFKIYLIIPNDIYLEINNFKLDIKIIKSDKRGQVYQRFLGFSYSKSKFTMQLDDDCFIDENSFLNLYSHIIEKNNICLGPVYYDVKTLLPIHKFNKSFIFLIKSLIVTFICSVPFGIKRMGKLSKINTNYGVDPNYMKSDTLTVDWLPGGCILHKTENLILENFFPFQGKAYCEDIMHSLLLKRKGIKLIAFKKSKCLTEFPIFPKSKVEIDKYFEAMKYCNVLSKNKSKIRFNVWIILNYIRNIFIKL